MMNKVIAVLKASLEGKINNLPHFKNEALLPVFEAVANSIQAIEELSGLSTGFIRVKLIRDSDLFDESGTEGKIQSILIEDTGVGFNSNNFESFCTSETTYKLEKGCKGVGRFFWLKAFDEVLIDSYFEEDSKKWHRAIRFKISGIESYLEECDFQDRKTIVTLKGYKEEYRKQPTSYKTTAKIAQRILEHCLSYYITDSSPDITVSDDGSIIRLSDLYSRIRSTIRKDSVEINGVKFSLNHVKLFSTHAKMHNMVLCANHRDVKSIGLSQIIGSAAQIDDGDARFVYAAYLESPYLDKHVDSSRMDFSIPEKTGLLQEDYPVSIIEIQRSTEKLIQDYLKEYVEAIKDKKIQIVENYVATINPGLRAVANYCPEVYGDLEPNSSEEKIDEVLYKYKGKTEYALKKISSEILKSQPATFSEVEERVNEAIEKISAFQKDQLSGYIIFRKIVIDILDKKLGYGDNGKYAKEIILHDALFPTKQNSDTISYDNHNLWLLDERLSFHAFANSDIPLSEIGINGCDERPDILTFSEVGPDRIARSVSIIELKRPQRKDYDEDPVKQMLRYVRKIRENKQIMYNGRTLTTDQTTKFYCYAVCDLTPAIIEFAENQQIAKLKGELGYYMYNSSFNAHIEIIAFDKIIADAIQRNKIFFEKLGIQ